jgi:hypothetical protein
MLKKVSDQDKCIPLLVQLLRVAMVITIKILAVIGDIIRFSNAKKLFGYAGWDACVYNSGMTISED